tara:strand:- start:1616 stop:2068 length:453 start_codon:yes stop_codon:yes gene_type:complete
MRTRAGVFRKDDYDELNDYAISMITEFLQFFGYDVPKKAEDFTIDIEAYRNGNKYRIEAEVRSDLWFTERETFPFDTVSFLGRKKKYEDISDFWYFLVCKKTGYAVYCNSKTIYQDIYRENIMVNNKKRYGNDVFYRVPKMLCKFINLKV